MNLTEDKAGPLGGVPSTTPPKFGLTCWRMLLKCSCRGEQRGSMIDLSNSERRRAFSIWLRTGRSPSARNADGIELKSNPWHDPENGRFTFVGAGRRYGVRSGEGGGGGATGSGDWPTWLSRPKPQNSASRATPEDPTRSTSPANSAASSKASAPKTSAPGTWAGGGFTGGGGGSFGEAGASGTWGSPEPKLRPNSSSGSATAIVSSGRPAATGTASARPASTSGEKVRTVVRNGYIYQIDSRERTRRVSGMLTVTEAPVRSRMSQRQAGGAERRASDDGGHYIAARFNGPSEAFNHFAQNANVNRGGYRVLENEWAREKRAGRAVTVRIVPRFEGGSIRPSMINVWWTVDGKGKSQQFPNERSEKHRGKR